MYLISTFIDTHGPWKTQKSFCVSFTKAGKKFAFSKYEIYFMSVGEEIYWQTFFTCRGYLKISVCVTKTADSDITHLNRFKIEHSRNKKWLIDSDKCSKAEKQNAIKWFSRQFFFRGKFLALFYPWWLPIKKYCTVCRTIKTNFFTIRLMAKKNCSFST